MTRRRLSSLSLLLLTCGCASLDPAGLWVLPPLDPPARDPAPPPMQVAGLSSTSVAVLGSRWRAGQVLELGHVLTAVEETYPLLSAARQERILAEARQLSALGAFDPQLRAGASWAATGYYRHNTADLSLSQATGLWGLRVWSGYRLGAGDFDPTFDGKRVTNHGGEVRVGASLPLLRDGAIDAARRELLTSTLDREIAESEVATRRLRFTRDATLAYWRWVAAGRRLAVAGDLLALAVERQRGIAARVRRGDLPELEATDNRRLVVRRRGLRIAARRRLERAALGLSLFLRDERGRPLRPSPATLPRDFPAAAPPVPAGLEADVQAALRQRPDLRQLAQRRGRVGVELRYARNRLLPQLDLTILGSQDLDRTRPSRTKGELELVAGITFGFPLFNRRARGEALAQRAKQEQLGERERYQRDAVEAEVRDAMSALRAAYAQVGQAREGAALARRVAAGERRRFRLGDSTVLVLNLREEAVAEADLRLVDARLAYWSASATYQAAVGAPPRP